jgi:hypothetical protein
VENRVAFFRTHWGGNELFSFNQGTDGYLKEKALILGSKHDESGALSIIPYSRNYDLKYVFINTIEDICKAIEAGAYELGKKIEALVLAAHGDPEEMELSSTRSLSKKTIFPIKCFDGLAPQAKIFLDSCETGQHPLGIAQHIADQSQRVVYAPETYISQSNIDQLVYGTVKGLQPLTQFNPRFNSRSFSKYYSCCCITTGIRLINKARLIASTCQNIGMILEKISKIQISQENRGKKTIAIEWTLKVSGFLSEELQQTGRGLDRALTILENVASKSLFYLGAGWCKSTDYFLPKTAYTCRRLLNIPGYICKLASWVIPAANSTGILIPSFQKN